MGLSNDYRLTIPGTANFGWTRQIDNQCAVDYELDNSSNCWCHMPCIHRGYTEWCRGHGKCMKVDSTCTRMDANNYD